MCGRYALTLKDKEALQELRDLIGDDFEMSPRYNIAPQQTAPVIRRLDDKMKLDELRWGFRPAWLKDKNKAQINARAETVFESKMFKHSALNRRCLVPATGWYEWQAREGGKQPHYFHRRDGGLLLLAGIWTTWHGEDGKDESNYAIITTEANSLAAPIHNRMPVILNEAGREAWLDSANQAVPVLGMLLQPYEGDGLDAYPVSTYVNAPKNTGDKCLERIAV